MAERGYTPEEADFQFGVRDTPWFREFAQQHGEPNLNDPNYDYRAAWQAGARPDVRDPTDNQLHWPSQFKGPNHPNRFVNGVDTITGQRMGDLAEQQMAQDAFAAAAARTRRPYERAIARDPASNRLGGLAEMMAPQSPLDYAMLAAGPMRALSVPARGMIMGAAAALDPSEAQAGASGLIRKGVEKVTGFAPQAAENVSQRIVKYFGGEPRVVEDPLHHGFSGLRTGKTPDEMQWTFKGQQNIERPLIRPEDIEGKEIIFAPGDRSIGGGGKVTSVGGTRLETPQRLEAGADYPFMHADKPVGDAQRIWANAKAQSTAMLNLGKEIQERGRDPVLMYQAMGKSSLDSSKQLALPAIDLAKQGSITSAGAEHINKWMRKEGFDDFPGWRSPRLADWAEQTSGTARSQLIKAMDTATARNAGFPDIGELRYALTNPQLRNTPTGSVGLTISKLDPTLGMTEKSLHSTYPTAVLGNEAATFGGSIPWHIGARDLHQALLKQGDPVRFAERPDYYSTRMPVGLPRTQVADPQWVDTVSEWMRKNPSLWAAPAAGPAMGAFAAQDQYQ